jgi:hypothetical protein
VEPQKKYFAYNKDTQTKFTPNHYEPFLQNVAKEQLFTLPTDKTSEDNGVRILPPWSAEGMFAKVTTLHYNVGINRTTFVCPNLHNEGACDFCGTVARLRSEYDKYKLDITEAGGKTRAYSNVLNTKLPNQGPFVFSYGTKIFFPIKKIQDSGEYGDICDPMEGRDIFIDRLVHGKNNFADTVRPGGKPSMITNVDALDNLFDLDTILPETDMDAFHRAFKSHPWKVYNAPTTVSVPASFNSQPKEEVVTEPKPQATPTASVDAQDKMKEIEAKLRAKLGR